TVLDTLAPAVLRDRPVIQREYRGAGEACQAVGDGPVTARAAGEPGAAVNVEQAPARVKARRQRPLPAQLAILDCCKARSEFNPVAERVHQLPHCPQPTA